MNLSKSWTGNLYGTNQGSLYIEIDQSGELVTGSLRINDTVLGVSVYEISGTYCQNSLKISGFNGREERAVSKIKIEGALNQQGALEGKWATSAEMAGVFVAFPFPPQIMPFPQSPIIPEQIHMKNIALAPIRLFSDDITRLIAEMKKDFSIGRIVVTYHLDGHEITEFIEDFLENKQNLDTLYSFRIGVQEPSGMAGVNKMVIIELGIFNCNSLRVQGPQECWVLGKAEKLTAILKPCQNVFITRFKKIGISFNVLIFMLMLILTPSIPNLKNRAAFVVGIFFVIMLLDQVYKCLIPVAKIKITNKVPSWLTRKSPSILTWMGGIAATLISAFLTHYFNIFGVH